jgi:hypothetical protein
MLVRSSIPSRPTKKEKAGAFDRPRSGDSLDLRGSMLAWNGRRAIKLGKGWAIVYPIQSHADALREGVPLPHHRGRESVSANAERVKVTAAYDPSPDCRSDEARTWGRRSVGSRPRHREGRRKQGIAPEGPISPGRRRFDARSRPTAVGKGTVLRRKA